MTETAGAQRLTCHHCGSSNLLLIEHVLHTSVWEGIDLVGGVIRPRSDVAYHHPGGPACKPTIHCEDCDRDWTPRRRIEFP